MKKSAKTIAIAIIIGFSLILAFILGTMQTKEIEVIPDGYIAVSECIPLEDIACYFMNGYDYPCFELKDVATQYNADNTRSYADIIRNLPDETRDFQENFIDMRMVTNFEADGNGLYLYLKNGTGYYWEK